ncbi:hypothetical protein PHYSODRAFT_261939 [Phytophthora sojae]|uniref:Glycosyltransferase 61 catalytic domain-containing protein n=1 Tax=Phytophthora sojae (strain P6497) TaxID=1094619 RepID=G5AG68_PHYSP|nr:hypothetical protein PHYSODRAFT_261939 [Phytophthora sojae]EGZ05580.1 hypothetical protein PHYSODRAFT_261939 [Phytophthora sojae]|eukprot:XP_009539111.1 hypothetical protein PHYSODRAFT_261939 [Phytophthora sojae]
MDQQWRAKFREPRWLQLLLGGSALFSVMMVFSLWTKLPSHEALRRPPTTAPVQQTTRQNVDLFTLDERRRNASATAKSKMLHIDDLALSDSYQHWAPVIVSECVHGMDERAAPCIKEANKTNLVEAQELMYPAFRLKLPAFTGEVMQKKWLSGGLHVERMRISDLQANASELENATRVDTVVVATSPDSWSFQHFIDRVAVVWSQAQLVLPHAEKNETTIVTGEEPRDSIVNEIYKVMVGQHLHEPKLVAAKRLVFSCRAPLIHPFTTQRITENILRELPPPQHVSEADRDVILFLSRSRGGRAANGGRQILNEPKLFDAIAARLNATGRPEQLMYFKHDEFNGLEEVATFMRDRVKMMIGRHGAAFYNARFAQPRTALIEIVPDPEQFFVPCFWEQARLLGQDYSAHVGNTQNEQNDMIVDEVQDVVDLVLKRLEYLDDSYRMEDSLGHTYAWGVDTTAARL